MFCGPDRRGKQQVCLSGPVCVSLWPTPAPLAHDECCPVDAGTWVGTQARLFLSQKVTVLASQPFQYSFNSNQVKAQPLPCTKHQSEIQAVLGNKGKNTLVMAFSSQRGKKGKEVQGVTRVATVHHHLGTCPPLAPPSGEDQVHRPAPAPLPVSTCPTWGLFLLPS